MYQLISNMTSEIVSTHKTLDAAIAAAKRFQKGSRKDTFCPWRIEDLEGNVVSKCGMLEATGYHDN